MLRLENFESVICLNGSLPSKRFFDRIASSKITVVAADGGAHRLMDIKVMPDFVVGDMDSWKGYEGICDTKIHRKSGQDSTDFEKSLFFLRDRNIKKILVLGVNGGEIDHVINNINTFLRYSDQFDMCFYDEPDFGESKIGRAVNGSMDLDIDEGSKISLFSFDEGKMKTQGMQWEIEDKAYQVMETSAARNKSKSDKVHISTTGKKLLTVYSGSI
jgi:thiamine pyrophosphokinase